MWGSCYKARMQWRMALNLQSEEGLSPIHLVINMVAQGLAARQTQTKSQNGRPSPGAMGHRRGPWEHIHKGHGKNP